MEQHLEEQSQIRQYLLGELDLERQLRLEEKLLADNQCFEELLVAEDDLIEKYLGGSLSPGDKEQFERYFLSTPARKRSLSFAATLREYISAREEGAPVLTGAAGPSASRRRFLFPHFWTQNPAISLSLAAALLLMVVGAAWLILRERQGNESGRHGGVLAVTLVAGATRSSGEITKIVIPANVDVVRLQFKPNADTYQSYFAVVQTVEGRKVLTSDELKTETADTSGNTLYLDVAAKLLSPGDYQLKLSGSHSSGGSEEIGGYNFRVMK